MTRSFLIATAVAFNLAATVCTGAEYSFALPALIGSPQGEQNLAVDLGGEFTSITAARLRIAGMHTPGLLGDLHSPPQQTFPYPASIDAYSPATPFNQSGILGEVLPSIAGPFEVDEAFRRIQPGGPPDFTTWLDGTANFYFSAHGGAYIAIYRELEQPTVNIASATLFVTGERVSEVTAPSADFDGNGAVDGEDLSRWQHGFASGSFTIDPIPDSDEDGDADGADFLAWQQQVGGNAATSPVTATAIPEPGSLALLAIAFAALAAIARHAI